MWKTNKIKEGIAVIWFENLMLKPFTLWLVIFCVNLFCVDLSLSFVKQTGNKITLNSTYNRYATHMTDTIIQVCLLTITKVNLTELTC